MGRGPIEVVPEVRERIIGDNGGLLSGDQGGTRRARVVEGVGIKRPVGEGGEAGHHVVRGQADLAAQPGGYELGLEGIGIPDALEERGEGLHAQLTALGLPQVGAGKDDAERVLDISAAVAASATKPITKDTALEMVRARRTPILGSTR